MKSTFFSLVALPALFVGAFAAPAPALDSALVERSELSSAYSIVNSLYANIKQYTGAISMLSSVSAALFHSDTS